MKRVCIAGGTGLIGARLLELLADSDYHVVSLTRNLKKSIKLLPKAKQHILFDAASTEFREAIGNSFAIINLSGASIAGKRWSKSYKKVILQSRIKTTAILSEAINKSSNPPKVFVNASAVGIYENSGDNTISEKSQTGHDFLADVCKQWEAEAFKSWEKCRVVTARTGIVLDKSGGALAKMLLPFKLFLGGPLGSGKQWMPWIHIEDTVRLYKWVIENENISGPVNFTAPKPVQMKTFAKTIGNVLKRPSVFKVPSFLLKIVLGESSVIVLSGQNSIPQKAMENGFKFKYSGLKEALISILKREELLKEENLL
ncbi:MAG: TIGR01777 family oxidoreductase [bacterium]